MNLKIILFSITIVLTCAKSIVDKPQPNDCIDVLSTDAGSYFEYAVRNVIHNKRDFPKMQPINNATELERMVYYYHLQMMHIDTLWLNNWQTLNKGLELPVDKLPSIAVKTSVHDDPHQEYVFKNGEKYTLESHRLECNECTREFECNVEHIPNHNSFSLKENPEGKLGMPLFLPTSNVEDMDAMYPKNGECKAFKRYFDEPIENYIYEIVEGEMKKK